MAGVLRVTEIPADLTWEQTGKLGKLMSELATALGRPVIMSSQRPPAASQSVRSSQTYTCTNWEACGRTRMPESATVPFGGFLCCTCGERLTDGAGNLVPTKGVDRG